MTTSPTPCDDCVDVARQQAKTYRREARALVKLVSEDRFNYCPHCAHRFTDAEKLELEKIAKEVSV